MHHHHHHRRGHHDERLFGPRGEGRQDDRRGERGFGRGRRGRPFEQGDLRWLVLDLIARQPRHGYEIIKAIEDALDGHYSPSPGVIYPTLTLLEETGLIASESQGAKKLYSLTGDGQAQLAAHAETLAAVQARMDGARARFGGVPAPEIMRAMANLRGALQVRLSRGALPQEAIGTVTAAIDRAAAEIERS